MNASTQSLQGGALVELLEKMSISELAIAGWSPGGHIGVELIPRLPKLKGLMIRENATAWQGWGIRPFGKNRRNSTPCLSNSYKMLLNNASRMGWLVICIL